MLRLFACEWLKLLKKRYVLIVLALFLLLNLFLIRFQFEARSRIADSRFPEERRAFLDLYPEYAGPLDAEKARAIIRELEELEPLALRPGIVSTTADPQFRTGWLQTDYWLLKFCFYDPLEYAFSYPEESARLIMEAEANVLFFQGVGNEEQARFNSDLAKSMSDRSIPRFSYLEPFDLLFENDLSLLLLLLVLLAAFSSAFADERENRMDELNGSSSARNKFVPAKLLAALSFLVVCFILFVLSDFFGTLMAYRIKPDFGLPLYALPAYQLSEMTLSLGSFYFLSSCYRLVGFVFLTLLLFFISSFFRRSLYPAALGLGLAAFLFFFRGADIPPRWQFLQMLNPLILLDRQRLFGTFSRVNIFGRLLPLHHVVLTEVLLLCLLLAIAIHYRGRPGHVRS